MITFIWLIAVVIIAVGAFIVYSTNRKGKASATVQQVTESAPKVGRAQGAGDN